MFDHIFVIMRIRFNYISDTTPLLSWVSCDKTNKMTCAPSEDSDQSGHPPSLIRVFVARMKKQLVISYVIARRTYHFVGFVVLRLIYCYWKCNCSICTCTIWTASSEFGTYRLCEQRRFRRACASAQSRQNLLCSLIQAVSQEEPSDRKPDPWPLWMAGHAQIKFVMTECSKTQIRLTGLIWWKEKYEKAMVRSWQIKFHNAI